MNRHRTSRWLAPILTLALVTGCESVSAPAHAEFVGVWDRRPWLGDASAMLLTGTPEGDVLYVFGTAPRGADAWGAQEVVSAHVRFEGPGLYALGPDDVYFQELTGGDVVSAQYQGTGHPAGTLRITHYDEAAGIVHGELEFSAATTSPYASYGSAARFQAGRFRADLTTQPVNVRRESP